MREEIIRDLNEVILSLSNFIQDGRVIANSEEIGECIYILMNLRSSLVGVEQAKERRTKKYLT